MGGHNILLTVLVSTLELQPFKSLPGSQIKVEPYLTPSRIWKPYSVKTLENLSFGREDWGPVGFSSELGQQIDSRD